MQFKTITYQRIKNLGDSGSEKLELSAELSPNDDVVDCINNLRCYVLDALGLSSELDDYVHSDTTEYIDPADVDF